MQDHVRIRSVGATSRYSRDERDPPFGAPVPANEDSWPDPHQFEQDVRALFSEEDLAVMRAPANTGTFDWSPAHAARVHGAPRFAPLSVLAIGLYAATAIGAGLYLVLDPFGPGTTETSVLVPTAARATEVQTVLAAPSAAPALPPVVPKVVAVAPTPEPEPIGAPERTADAGRPEAPGPTEPPAPVVADPAPAASPVIAVPAAAPKPEAGFAQAFSDVGAAQPKAVRPKAPDVFTPGQAAAHLARASALLQTGQIPAARAVLLLLAEQGNTEANYRYGRTFDPKVLAAMGAVGVRSDVAVARKYYAIAAEAGHAAARQALESL